MDAPSGPPAGSRLPRNLRRASLRARPAWAGSRRRACTRSRRPGRRTGPPGVAAPASSVARVTPSWTRHASAAPPNVSPAPTVSTTSIRGTSTSCAAPSTTTRTASPPSVTKIALGPSAASHATPAARSAPGRRNARSSMLTLTTSARARIRRHPGPVRRRVADDRRPAVRVDQQEHVVRERRRRAPSASWRSAPGRSRASRRAPRASLPAARPRVAPARARTSRPCRSGTSRRPTRPAPRGRASSAGRCAGRGRGRRRRR